MSRSLNSCASPRPKFSLVITATRLRSGTPGSGRRRAGARNLRQDRWGAPAGYENAQRNAPATGLCMSLPLRVFRPAKVKISRPEGHSLVRRRAHLTADTRMAGFGIMKTSPTR